MRTPSEAGLSHRAVHEGRHGEYDGVSPKPQLLLTKPVRIDVLAVDAQWIFSISMLGRWLQKQLRGQAKILDQVVSERLRPYEKVDVRVAGRRLKLVRLELEPERREKVVH